MIDERDVREMLLRGAMSVPATPADTQTAVRRARRRLVLNGVAAAAAVVAITVATFVSVDAIRSAPIPANQPNPVPGPDVLRANGEVLSFTGAHGAPGDLVAVNPQTGEERVLAENLNVYSAKWSADGRWVAYETPGPEGAGLWVVGASREARRVAAGESLGAWSSTGAELGTVQLSSSPKNLAGSTVSTLDLATGQAKDVGALPANVGDVGSPAWSPDLTRFVFGARGGGIYSIDVLSGESSLLVRLPGAHLDSVDQIVWSPDGAHIAVVNDGDPGGVYAMDVDGSNVRTLADHYSGAAVAWSPDGTRLAYQDGAGVIWAASVDGSAPTKIGTPLPASGGYILLSQADLTWSPDGSRIAFRTVWFGRSGDVGVDVSAIDADGRGHAERIDELTFEGWDGGAYSCGCE